MTRNPNRQKLGRRQKKMLDDMKRHGTGMWLPKWPMTSHQQECMDTLLQRGLVETVTLRASHGATQVYRIVGS